MGKIESGQGINCSNRILVVDDDIFNLKILEKVLTGDGYDVLTAGNGESALALAKAHLPELILLDIMMPAMDGIEVCRILKADEQTRDATVIFVSAIDQVRDKMDAFEAGGADFISKPYEAEEILACIRTHFKLRHKQRKLE